MVKLKIAHKLLISGVAFALQFAVLLYCAVAGIESQALPVSTIVFSVALAALAGGLLFITGRNLSRALARFIAVAGEIAGGRLKKAEQVLADHRERGYFPAWQFSDETSELATAFRTMAVNLNAPLAQVIQSGADLSSSSIQVAASVKQLEASVVGQASSTNEVTAATREIFATVQELAGTVRAVQQMASEAARLASAGLESLKGINSTMSELLDATGDMSSVLNIISDRAATITQVITTITNIANRTNLISLNAAIEAEKAGEYAGGFSVVALEIRRLADQTAVAALDIEKVIGEMQAAVKDGAAGMSRYAAGARASSQTVAGITSDLSHVIEYTRQLEPHFEVVNNGMQEQSRAAEQILEVMQQLAGTAGQTRDSLAQFRQVADQMRSTAQLLQAQVGRFSVGA